MADDQQLNTHWQAKVRIVGYDAGSPEIINRQKRIDRVRCPLPVLTEQKHILPTNPSAMQISLTTHQLGLLLRDAAEMGAKSALAKTGKIKPYLNKSQAFRLFGRKNIEKWIAQGLIIPRKDGSHSATWRIDRIEVEAISKSFNAMIHL